MKPSVKVLAVVTALLVPVLLQFVAFQLLAPGLMWFFSDVEWTMADSLASAILANVLLREWPMGPLKRVMAEVNR